MYFGSIIAKTASLFSGAMEMVGVLARAGKREVTNLRDFGHEVGIAYQIVDDILDITSDEESLGKPVGSDLAQGIITLPVICYLERNKSAKEINRIFSKKRTSKDTKNIIKMIRESGAIDDALDEASAHARKSKAALSYLPAGNARKALYSLVDYIMARAGGQA